MTEVTVSARIPRDMDKEVEEIMREEHLERSAAIRKLLHLGLDRYRQERALRLLAEGKVTLSRAAEIARMSLWELADLVRERKIAWVADDALDDVKGLARK
ncbi:MAG TPA: ribbon-helix-helix protein, CopG family [Thermoplasmata archaeon]